MFLYTSITNICLAHRGLCCTFGVGIPLTLKGFLGASYRNANNFYSIHIEWLLYCAKIVVGLPYLKFFLV